MFTIGSAALAADSIGRQFAPIRELTARVLRMRLSKSESMEPVVTRERGFCHRRLHGAGPIQLRRALLIHLLTAFLVIALFFTALPLPMQARAKNVLQYGAGLIVNIPLPVDEVTQAVGDVAGNGIIRGTKEYNKDEYVTRAVKKR